MTTEDRARAALAALGDRPVLARGRILRFLGEHTAADEAFTAAGNTLAARGEAQHGSTQVSLLIDAGGAFIEASRSGRGLALLERALGSASASQAARIAAWAAMAKDRELAERAVCKAHPGSIATQLTQAWLDRDDHALSAATDALRSAMAAPPLGPQEPWENSEVWSWLRWARGAHAD